MQHEGNQEKLTRQEKFNQAVRTGNLIQLKATLSIIGMMGTLRSYATTKLPVDINSPISVEDINDSDSEGENDLVLQYPICIAMEKGHHTILAELLTLTELNVSNILDNEFQNSLAVVVENKKWAVLEVLLKDDSVREKMMGSFKIRKVNAKPLAHVLLMEKKFELLKTWINFCALAFPEEINSEDEEGNRLIHLLVEAQEKNVILNEPLIKQLLAMPSFQIGVKNNKNDTALMLLAKKATFLHSSNINDFIKKAVSSGLEGNIREVFVTVLSSHNFILAKLLYDLDKENRPGFKVDLQKFMLENLNDAEILQKILRTFDPKCLTKLKFRVNGGDHNVVVAAAYYNKTAALEVILKSTIFPVNSVAVLIASENNSAEALALLFAQDYLPLDSQDAQQLSEAGKKIYNEQLYNALLKAVDNKRPPVAVQKFYAALTTRQQNIFGEKRGTLLHVAVESDEPEFLQMVAQENWPEEALNRVNKEEHTALDVAINKKNSFAVKMLLSQGAVAMQDDVESALIDVLKPYEKETDYKTLFLQALLVILNNPKLNFEKGEEKVTQILIQRSQPFLKDLQLQLKSIAPDTFNVSSISSQDKILLENIIAAAFINSFDLDLKEEVSSQISSETASMLFVEEDLLSSSVKNKEENEEAILISSSEDLGPNSSDFSAPAQEGKGMKFLWDLITQKPAAVLQTVLPAGKDISNDVPPGREGEKQTPVFARIS